MQAVEPLDRHRRARRARRRARRRGRARRQAPHRPRDRQPARQRRQVRRRRHQRVAATADDGVQIAVEDRGAGVPEEDRELDLRPLQPRRRSPGAGAAATASAWAWRWWPSTSTCTAARCGWRIAPDDREGARFVVELPVEEHGMTAPTPRLVGSLAGARAARRLRHPGRRRAARDRRQRTSRRTCSTRTRRRAPRRTGRRARARSPCTSSSRRATRSGWRRSSAASTDAVEAPAERIAAALRPHHRGGGGGRAHVGDPARHGADRASASGADERRARGRRVRAICSRSRARSSPRPSRRSCGPSPSQTAAATDSVRFLVDGRTHLRAGRGRGGEAGGGQPRRLRGRRHLVDRRYSKNTCATP